MRSGLIIFVAFVLAGSLQAGSASGATGDLTFGGCVGDLTGCTTTSPASALDGANTSAISPDGKQLYVAADATGKGLNHFSLSGTGVPTFENCVGSVSGCTSTSPSDALDATWGVALSPDGKHLYATSDGGNDISYFTLDSSGAPTFAGCIGDHTGCTATTPSGALDDAKQPIISPDGHYMYVSSGNGALDYLTLDSAGVPTLVGCIGQVSGCTSITPTTALNGARFMAASAGGQLYVGAPGASDVAHFSINTLTGVPAFVGCVGDHPGCTATTPATALDGAYGVALSVDAKHLYVTSATSSDLGYLSLDSFGNPSLVGCVGDLSGCTPTKPTGVMSGGRGAAVSPDGTQLYALGDTANAINHFTLDRTGKPTFVDCVGDHSGCTPTTPANALDTVYSLSLSADGKHLYSDDNFANNVAYLTVAGTLISPPPSKPSCSLTPLGARVFATALASAAKRHKKKQPRGVLRLSAHCNQGAGVTLTGTVTAVIKKKSAKVAAGKKHMRKKSKSFKIAPVRASITNGQTLTLTVKLPKTALAALKKGARESVTFTLTASNANGTGTATAKITRLKLAKTKIKKHQ